jgi:hypothetical protein
MVDGTVKNRNPDYRDKIIEGQELNTVPEVNALQNVYITMKMEESKTTKLLKKLLTAQRFWKLKTIKKN